MVIRTLKELSEDLKSTKEIQSETKDSLIQIKGNNHLQGNNSRVDEVENQINDLDHKEAKNNQSKQQEEKRIQKELPKIRILQQPLGQLQKVQHSHHKGARRRERARNWKSIENIMKENFPNLVKEIDTQIQEAQRVPNKMNPKRPTPRPIIIKMQNVCGDCQVNGI